MSRGLFTQTLCVLLKSDVPLEAIAKVLAPFEPKHRDSTDDSWEFSGPSLQLDVPDQDRGYVIVDVVAKPWPDEMGFEEQESTLFQAWDAGQFGPFTFPGSLERASEQSWGWPEGRSAASQCTGFIRVRLGYELDDDASPESVFPDEFNPIGELAYLTSICSKLLTLPQAICYFNPNGEVLRDQNSFRESEELCEEHDIPTIDLWSNIRLFRFDSDWAMMDTVGNSQLGLPDIEACFDAESYEYNSVDQLLRTVSMYLVGDEEFEEGEEIEDEAGVTWRMSMHEDSLCDPPRPVIRLLPNDGRDVPEELLEKAE